MFENCLELGPCRESPYLVSRVELQMSSDKDASRLSYSSFLFNSSEEKFLQSVFLCVWCRVSHVRKND